MSRVAGQQILWPMQILVGEFQPLEMAVMEQSKHIRQTIHVNPKPEKQVYCCLLYSNMFNSGTDCSVATAVPICRHSPYRDLPNFGP